jgi:hypothetical protein
MITHKIPLFSFLKAFFRLKLASKKHIEPDLGSGQNISWVKRLNLTDVVEFDALSPDHCRQQILKSNNELTARTLLF